MDDSSLRGLNRIHGVVHSCAPLHNQDMEVAGHGHGHVHDQRMSPEHSTTAGIKALTFNSFIATVDICLYT